MRISNLMIKRNYTTQLNASQKRMYDSNMKVQTRRRFRTMSEDVGLGLRAMKIRRDIDKNIVWQDNVEECKGVLKASEDIILYGITPLCDTTQFEKYMQALNGTCGPDEYAAIRAELEKTQDEILKNLNADFAGRYLFGGSLINEAPFSVDSATGKLMYKGVLVEDIDPADPAYDYLTKDPVYIDIGLGMKMDSANNPIPSTVFDRSINGLDIVGTGKDNLYDILGGMIESLKTGNLDDQYLKRMETANNNAKVMLTKLGASDNYLTFAADRLELDWMNLTERQDALEFVDPAEAILEFEMLKYSYNASLQMGSSILAPGLFSFLR